VIASSLERIDTFVKRLVDFQKQLVDFSGSQMSTSGRLTMMTFASPVSPGPR